MLTRPCRFPFAAIDPIAFRLTVVAAASAFLLLGAGAAPVAAQGAERPKDSKAALDAVVSVTSAVPADARTVASLGTKRAGSGVVIDNEGLIVTVGYIVMEASSVLIGTAEGKSLPATVLGIDHETGLGLLRAAAPLGVAPMKLGRGRDVERGLKAMVASRANNALDADAAIVADRRPFAGYWEYYLDRAIFTVPPHEQFGGAALIDEDGRLIGIGSLFIGQATDAAMQRLPGNMFIPIDLLGPVMADLLSAGKRAGPARPWLGLQSDEDRRHVWVRRVTGGAPAEKSGLKEGDLIVGVGDRPVSSLAEFYKTIWGLGDAGVTVPLKVLRGMALQTIDVRSIDRNSWLKLNPTY